MFKEPYYEAEIKTSGCAVELYINGILSFNNFERGGMAVDWPINEFILESGEQNFTLKLYPYDDDNFILEKATAELNIFVREAYLEKVPREIVSENKVPLFTEKNVPFYELSNIFMAKVPYKVEGWKNSLDLSKEKPKELVNELQEIGDKLHKIFSTINYDEYYQFNKARLEEFSIVNYYSEEQKNINKRMVFQGTNMYIKPFDISEHKLVIYAEGRLVSLQAQGQPPGFKFEPINKKEHDGFIVMALFHRKDKNGPLILIR